jgi:hypothetical protein
MSSPEERILSGQLWEEYCDTLKRAGQQLLRPETPKTSFDQAEGMRYLSRLIRAGLEQMVEAVDTDFPTLVVPSHETIKYGGDSPDNFYQTARIDGRNEYRIRGTRGTVPLLIFSTKKGGYDRTGTLEGTGHLGAADLQLSRDDSFEIVVSSRRPPSGNWLPMEESSHMLLVRQTFRDRKQDAVAKLSIERIGEAKVPAPLDPAKFAASLLGSASFVEKTAGLFCDWAKNFQTHHHNSLPLGDQRIYQAAGGDPNALFYQGYFDLKADEAMVVDFALPRCEFWNFQLNNHWMESLDYRYHRIHLNQYNAHYNADGSVTLVIAHQAPGHPNWLSTTGHQVGTNILRILGVQDQAPEVQTRVVKFADIAGKEAGQ